MESFTKSVCKRLLHELAGGNVEGFAIKDGTLHCQLDPYFTRPVMNVLVKTKQNFPTFYCQTHVDNSSLMFYVDYSVELTKDEAIDFIVDFLLEIARLLQMEE